MMVREGGNRALVDFHVTPPLGSNMSLRAGERAAELYCTSAVLRASVLSATIAKVCDMRHRGPDRHTLRAWVLCKY